MHILKSCKFYFKLLFLYIKGIKVDYDEYKDEYDQIAPTYNIWINKMGKYTDEILGIDLLKKEPKKKILDFACGTGYITESILKQLLNYDIHIIAVDISKKMIEIARKNIIDKRVSFIDQNGYEFLNNEESSKFDAIYFGYALPYFDRKFIIQHFWRILKDNGTVHLITNCKGTLKGVNKIIFRIMKNNPCNLAKILDIGIKLPRNHKSLISLFKKCGFNVIRIRTINETVEFDEPASLYQWLINTGALAGVRKIFSDYETIEQSVIEGIQKSLYQNNKYAINHRFIQAIFQKKSENR